VPPCQKLFIEDTPVVSDVKRKHGVIAEGALPFRNGTKPGDMPQWLSESLCAIRFLCKLSSQKSIER
jgi:hypothetical protein